MFFRGGQDYFYFHRDNLLDHFHTTCFFGICYFPGKQGPYENHNLALILGVLPVLGALLYLLFGSVVRKHKLSRHKQVKLEKTEEILRDRQVRPSAEDVDQAGDSPMNQKLARLMLNDADAPMTLNNRSEVLTNGKKTFRALFSELEKAKDHIHLEYYIFHDDGIGGDILNLLMRKASEGVKIRVLVDGLANRSLTKRFGELKNVGVETAGFY